MLPSQPVNQLTYIRQFNVLRVTCKTNLTKNGMPLQEDQHTLTTQLDFGQ